MVDVLRQKTHRTVAVDKHRSPRMERFESHRSVPSVLRCLATAAASARVSWHSIFARTSWHVDRCRRGKPQSLRQCPTVGVLKARALAANFAHADHVGCSVGDFGKPRGPGAAAPGTANAVG